MSLVSKSETLVELRDEIGSYLAFQAKGFLSRKNVTRSKPEQRTFQAIADAVQALAENVNGIRFERATEDESWKDGAFPRGRKPSTGA